MTDPKALDPRTTAALVVDVRGLWTGWRDRRGASKHVRLLFTLSSREGHDDRRG